MQAYFLNPERLILLLLVPLVYLLLTWSDKRLRVLAKQLRSQHRPAASSPHVALAICALVILGLAKPYWGYEEFEVPSTGTEIVAALDLSKSMWARDVLPNRLEFARRKLIDLIRIVEERGQGDRIAIILFAQDSYVLSPLTSDYAALRTYAQAISPRLLNDAGSSLAEAVRATLLLLNRSSRSEAHLVLFTDGEDSEFSVAEILKLRGDSMLSVSSIGIGSTAGSAIDLGRNGYLRDGSGNVVISKLAEDSLKELASQTDGSYRQAQIGPDDLRAFLSNIAPTKQGEARVIRNYNELGSFCALAIFLIVIVQCAWHRTSKKETFQRSLFFLACFSVFCSSPSLAESQPQAFTLRQYLESGKYEEALKGFSELAASDPENPDIHAALGAASFGLKRFKDAARHYEKQFSLAASGRGKFEALYNQGTSLLMAEDAEGALKALESALEIKPDDQKAVHNLKLARELLEKKQPTPTPTPSEETKQSSKNEQQDQSQPKKGSPEKEENETKNSKESGSSSSIDNSSTDKSETNSSSNSSGASDSAAEGEDTEQNEHPSEEEQSGSSLEEAAGKNEPLTKEDQAELQAWLDTLEDSPVIVRPQRRNRPLNGGQSW